MSLSGSVVATRTEGTVNWEVGQGAPASGVNADYFSTRWTGQIQAPSSGVYNFRTTTDDGVRLWVNNQRVVDLWRDQAPTAAQGAITLNGGQRYDIKMEYYDKTGGAVAKLEWQRPGAGWETVPKSVLYSGGSGSPAPDPAPDPAPNPVTGAGLKGEYFANQNLGGAPTVTRIDPTINFAWGTEKGPAAGIGKDSFSARWTGKMNVAQAGNYTFYGTTDDGMRLFIDDKPVIDTWYNKPDTTVQGSTYLGSGQHSIRMEYYDNTWNATAKLEWASPTVGRQIVPQSALTPT